MDEKKRWLKAFLFEAVLICMSVFILGYLIDSARAERQSYEMMWVVGITFMVIVSLLSLVIYFFAYYLQHQWMISFVMAVSFSKSIKSLFWFGILFIGLISSEQLSVLLIAAYFVLGCNVVSAFILSRRSLHYFRWNFNRKRELVDIAEGV